MTKEVEIKPLSKKHLFFVNEVFICNLNATEAYMKVYKPKGGRAVARVNASRLLSIANIKAEFEARLEESQMSANRALQLMSSQAEGDIGDALEITPIGHHINLKKLKELGKTHLLKKVKQKTITINGKQEDKETFIEEIEFHDSQSAIRDILKIHKKLTEQIDLTSNGQNITPTIIEIIKEK